MCELYSYCSFFLVNKQIHDRLGYVLVYIFTYFYSFVYFTLYVQHHHDNNKNTGVAVGIISIFVLTMGSQVPRNPKQKKHHLTPKSRVILGQIFFLAMILLALWSIIGGFVAYFFVKDYMVDYCTECVKENCGCDDLCADDFNSLKTLTYFVLTFSIIVSVIVSVTFGRWTQKMLGYLEMENPDTKTAMSLHIQNVPLLDLDSYCCCWCPGVQSCYTMKTLSDAADGVGDAAEAAADGVIGMCEALFPFICCTIVLVVYLTSIILCWSDGSIPGWIRVISCIIAFIIYVLAEGSK